MTYTTESNIRLTDTGNRAMVSVEVHLDGGRFDITKLAGLARWMERSAKEYMFPNPGSMKDGVSCDQ